MILIKSKIICDVPSKLFRLISTSICPSPVEPVVTILDSLSPAGENLALLLKQNPYIKELRLYDAEANTCGLAKDLYFIDTKTIVRSYSCKSLKGAIQGAHLVISLGGHQGPAEKTLKEVFYKNFDSIRNAAIHLAEFNPKAIFCIAKPPVAALVPMASDEYKKAETYDPRKIIGVTTYSSMIVNTLVAQHFNRNPMEVLCPVIGGMTPNTIIPVLSQIRPNLELNLQVYGKIREEAKDMLKKGNKSGYAKAAAVARFADLILKSLVGEATSVECAFVAQTGHIRQFLPYMTSVVKLGPDGVLSTHMPKMNETEVSLLRAVEPETVKNILFGENFLSGGFSVSTAFKAKRICDPLLKEKLIECNRAPQN